MYDGWMLVTQTERLTLYPHLWSQVTRTTADIISDEPIRFRLDAYRMRSLVVSLAHGQDHEQPNSIDPIRYIAAYLLECSHTTHALRAVVIRVVSPTQSELNVLIDTILAGASPSLAPSRIWGKVSP